MGRRKKLSGAEELEEFLVEGPRPLPSSNALKDDLWNHIHQNHALMHKLRRVLLAATANQFYRMSQENDPFADRELAGVKIQHAKSD